jgi:hypothetical protein
LLHPVGWFSWNGCLLPKIKCSLCYWHVCLVLLYCTTGCASLSVCWSGTLIQGAVLDKRTAIGLILGTGSNACYMERANRVQHWEGQRHGEKQVMFLIMIPIYIDLHLFHTLICTYVYTYIPLIKKCVTKKTGYGTIH